MKDPSLDDGPSGNNTARKRYPALPNGIDANGPVMSDKLQVVVIDLENGCIAGAAQVSRTRSYVDEYTLCVSRRTRDCRQNLCSGGLLLTGLRKLYVQLPVPAFRRGKIVGGRSCHDYTPSHEVYE